MTGGEGGGEGGEEENCHMLITSPLNEGGRDKNKSGISLKLLVGFCINLIYKLVSDLSKLLTQSLQSCSLLFSLHVLVSYAYSYS